MGKQDEQVGSASVTRPLLGVPTRGRRIGSYDLVGRLGRGGSSNVYLAVLRGSVEGFQKLVVLKQLQAAYREDPHYVHMFQREARLAAIVSHPNVVQTFSVEEEHGDCVIVMEYLDGVALSSVLKRVQDDGLERYWGALVWGLCQALAGLHHVHELRDYDGQHLKLVHRDIKPGNIFITYDGQVKLLDFGVARIGAGSTDVSTSTYLKGTVQYMAPEALDDTVPVDRRADLFSAGVILWELLHGRRMWGSHSQVHILRALATQSLIIPSAPAHAGVPDGLREICARALEVEPDARPSDALALKREIMAQLAAANVEHGTECLAHLVAQLFHDRKERRDLEIRDRLEALAYEGSCTPASFSTEIQPTESNAQTHQSARVAIAGRPRKRRHVGVVALSALAASLGLATVITAAQPEDVHVPDDAWVVLQISAAPSNAQLFMDDRPLRNNPAIIEHPRDGSPHTFVARAPGYAERRVEVRFDRDRELELELRPDDSIPRRRNASRRSASPR